MKHFKVFCHRLDGDSLTESMRDTLVVEIVADSRQQAKKAFQKRHPDLQLIVMGEIN